MKSEAAATQTTDIPCATLMVGDLEFVSQTDGSILVVTDQKMRFHRVEGAIAKQLYVWLSNHLRWCANHGR